MTIVFSGMLYNTCLAYLDNIIIFGRTFNEHLERLELALKRLKNANLKLKPSKCSFGQRSVTFLGHIISDKGISTDPAKLKRIQEWPQPRNQGEMRSFLGYATIYRKFIKGFAHIAAPLNRLLQKEEAYKWSPDCDAAFEALKTAFSEIVTLAHPDLKRRSRLTPMLATTVSGEFYLKRTNKTANNQSLNSAGLSQSLNGNTQ